MKTGKLDPKERSRYQAYEELFTKASVRGQTKTNERIQSLLSRKTKQIGTTSNAL